MPDNLNPVLAQQYLQEAVAVFARDRGRLWGMSLG